MSLDNQTIRRFAKMIKEQSQTTDNQTIAYGTAVQTSDGYYVRLDGSGIEMPVATLVGYKPNDRVTVVIKDHQAVVIGNSTNPSMIDLDGMLNDGSLAATLAKIDQAYINGAQIEQASISYANIDNAFISDLIADNGNFKTLYSEILKAEHLSAKVAEISDLKADDAFIVNLSSLFISTEKIDAVSADIKKAVIESLDTKYANIDFTNIDLAAIRQFYATSGIIKDLVIEDENITGELVGVTIRGDLIETNTIVADKLVIKGEDGLYYKLNTDGITIEAEQTDYNSLNGSVIRAKSVTADKIAVTDLVAFNATIAGFHITESSLFSGAKTSAINTTRGIYFGKDGQVGIGDSDNYIKYYKDQNGNFKLAVSAGSVEFSTGKSVEEAFNEVKSVDTTVVTYQVSNDGTIPPTGTWSVGIPTVKTDQYLWTRTIITYTDGSDTTLYSVSSMGATGPQGPQGEKGATGESYWQTEVWVDVSSSTYDQNKWYPVIGTGLPADARSTIEVCVALNSGTKPSWSTHNAGFSVNLDIQTQASGWGTNNINTLIYNDTCSWITSDAASPVSYKQIGEYSIPVLYLRGGGKYLVRTTYPGTWTPKTSSYSMGSDPYVRTVEPLTYRPTPEGKSVEGSDGRGIASTSVTYQAGSSATSAPTGSWVSSPPSASASAPYMWTRTIITYTDNTTSTSYSVGATPEGVVVGGRNLLLNSGNLTKWAIESGISCHYEGEWLYVSDMSHTSSRWGIYYDLTNYEQNTEYTISVDVRYGNATIGLSIGFGWFGNAVDYISSGTKKIKYTFNTGTNTAFLRVYLFMNPTTKNTYGYFKLPKLEKGNKATDWTPAPEDQVDKGDVVNQVNSELKIDGKSISLTTGHFTISSKNFTLDSAGNATFSGDIKGAKGEFTRGFDVSIPITNSSTGFKIASRMTVDTDGSINIYTLSRLINGSTDSITSSIQINSSDIDISSGHFTSGSDTITEVTKWGTVSINSGYRTHIYSGGKILIQCGRQKNSSIGSGIEIKNLYNNGSTLSVSGMKVVANNSLDISGDLNVNDGRARLNAGCTISNGDLVANNYRTYLNAGCYVTNGISTDYIACRGIKDNTGIYSGNGDGGGQGVANLFIQSWWGVGFVDGCTGQGMTASVDCRSGDIWTKGYLNVNGGIIVNNANVIIGNNQIYSMQWANSEHNYIHVNTNTGAYGINVWASDSRLKKNIKTTEVSGLDFVNRIRHVYFEWTNPIRGLKPNKIGYLADQLQELDPDTVIEVKQPDGSEFDTILQINETKLIPYLSKAIQEQYDIIYQLEKRIMSLEKNLSCT